MQTFFDNQMGIFRSSLLLIFIISRSLLTFQMTITFFIIQNSFSISSFILRKIFSFFNNKVENSFSFSAWRKIFWQNWRPRPSSTVRLPACTVWGTSVKLKDQDTKGNKPIIIITELSRTLVLIRNFDTPEKLKD